MLDEPGALERRALELAEERDRALAALKELEFDHRTGKISDEDYRELVGPLRPRVAEALRALEPHEPSRREERVRSADEARRAQRLRSEAARRTASSVPSAARAVAAGDTVVAGGAGDRARPDAGGAAGRGAAPTSACRPPRSCCS